MNTTENAAQLLTNFLHSDNRFWETTVTVDNDPPVTICFAKDPLELDGKLVVLGVVMTEKPHTLFFDCDQLLTSEFSMDECKLVLSQSPWDATESCYVKGYVTLTRCFKQGLIKDATRHTYLLEEIQIDGNCDTDAKAGTTKAS